MDRGIPTEEVLAEMRASDPPVHYLVGTPKGRLSKLEGQLWHAALAERAAGKGEVKALAAGRRTLRPGPEPDRINKERAMRRRQFKAQWQRLRNCGR